MVGIRYPDQELSLSALHVLSPFMVADMRAKNKKAPSVMAGFFIFIIFHLQEFSAGITLHID
ncbi:hypothetical protein [Paenochrobactrum glaciei]|uniref:Uncharacterized protein n=1 Tax=Paenochrobactrum glaciei TaxID=486407 RepID=A0ABN1GF33_9HYPH